MLDFLANPKTQHRHKPRIMLKITSNVWVCVGGRRILITKSPRPYCESRTWNSEKHVAVPPMAHWYRMGIVICAQREEDLGTSSLQTHPPSTTNCSVQNRRRFAFLSAIGPSKIQLSSNSNHFVLQHFGSATQFYSYDIIFSNYDILKAGVLERTGSFLYKTVK